MGEWRGDVTVPCLHIGTLTFSSITYILTNFRQASESLFPLDRFTFTYVTCYSMSRMVVVPTTILS